MQRAGDERPGTMAAVVGLPSDTLDRICTEASVTGIVQPANYNSPGQTVISGSVDGVHRAMELAKAGGAKIVKELVVSGAFHSPLMESAGEELHKALQAADIRDARIPVYMNVTAGPVTRSAEIRALLHRQLTSPVRWEETLRAMVRDGADTFYELGPGKVLQGLAKRIGPGVLIGGFDTETDMSRS
jgi:[acyl-carrier-protein] S-malonyltransferase